MAMTLTLPPELDDEIGAVAEEDRRSVHQTVVHAVKTYLAQRETEEVRSDSAACASRAVLDVRRSSSAYRRR